MKTIMNMLKIAGAFFCLQSAIYGQLGPASEPQQPANDPVYTLSKFDLNDRDGSILFIVRKTYPDPETLRWAGMGPSLVGILGARISPDRQSVFITLNQHGRMSDESDLSLDFDEIDSVNIKNKYVQELLSRTFDQSGTDSLGNLSRLEFPLSQDFSKKIKTLLNYMHAQVKKSTTSIVSFPEKELIINTQSGRQHTLRGGGGKYFRIYSDEENHRFNVELHKNFYKENMKDLSVWEYFFLNVYPDICVNMDKYNKLALETQDARMGEARAAQAAKLLAETEKERQLNAAKERADKEERIANRMKELTTEMDKWSAFLTDAEMRDFAGKFTFDSDLNIAEAVRILVAVKVDNLSGQKEFKSRVGELNALATDIAKKAAAEQEYLRKAENDIQAAGTAHAFVKSQESDKEVTAAVNRFALMQMTHRDSPELTAMRNKFSEKTDDFKRDYGMRFAALLSYYEKSGKK
jgi:hypothetical protein